MNFQKLFRSFGWIVFAAMGTYAAKAQTNFRSISFDEAITAAKAENKMVFIDFYTDWCGPCKKMARDVFPQQAVGEYMNSRFVCIKLNAEKEGKDLAARYKVQAYPTFVVTDTNRKVVMTKIGGASAENLLAEIDRKTNPDGSPQRMKERYDSGERSAALVAAYAAYKMSTDRTGTGAAAQEAHRIVKDYFDNLSQEARLLHENLFIYTRYANNLHDSMARFMITNRNSFATEDREKIQKTIETLYKDQAYRYLMKYVPYNDADYRQMKEEMNALGLNKDGAYDGVFQLIECYAKGNLNTFLKLCEKVYSKLNEEQQSCLIGSMGSLINTDDKALRKKAALFIRSRLATMTVNQLGSVAYPLMILEK